MAIDPKDAFLHVIYDYRCLATAGYAWSVTGPAGAHIKEANLLLPEVGTMIQDSIHVHARSLIDFYTKQAPWPTDVVLSRFSSSISISAGRATYLESMKHPIEVHSLHLTEWRDVPYRTTNANTRDGATRGRPQWATENTVLVDQLIEALKEVSQQQSRWQKPFAELYSAVVARLTDGSYDWPTNLGEKRDVENYLVGLGL
ncbi:hypothetical protein ACQPXH_24040 [Nocardia sp. CA-135953]|uniref:hypothetical protein n=1 Tax=Nocardia sp. CA-135953 TaxID=3239978 RepID=UPI003D9884E8